MVFFVLIEYLIINIKGTKNTAGLLIIYFHRRTGQRALGLDLKLPSMLLHEGSYYPPLDLVFSSVIFLH